MHRGPTTSLAIAAIFAAFLGLAAGGAGATVPKARLLPSGKAVAPPSAPASVKVMIGAADHIRHRPYR